MGYDPGTGRSKASALAADGTHLAGSTQQISSVVANGDRSQLLLRSNEEDVSLSKVLRPDEHVVAYNGVDYFLGNLAEREGKNADNAEGAAERYFNEHALVRLLGLSAMLIKMQRSYELRVVTGLPYSLYTNKEHRRRMKQFLEGRYIFTYNGEPAPREVTIKVGVVVSEGQGILASVTENTNETRAVIDIGFRTTDLVAIDESGMIVKYCDSKPLGLGQVADAVIQLYAKEGRILKLEDAISILMAYQQGKTLPVVKVRNQTIAEETVREVIRKSLKTVGRNIQQFVSGKWGSDKVGIAGDFDSVWIAGGSSYYFDSSIRELIPTVQRPSEPEFANARGYRDLAAGLEVLKPTIWVREWE